MASLVATSACGSALPLTVGSVSLIEIDPGPMCLILPFNGSEPDLQDQLMAATGMKLPAPNCSEVNEASRLIWFGRECFMLTGTTVGDLSECAAVTDQSDAWACVEISGDALEDVLARLVPIDLRPSAFPTGATARSLLGHMTASFTRTGYNRILIMVFRSMALTLVEELKEAMEAVAARG